MSEQGRKLVTDYYMQGDEKSPQEAFARASTFFASNEAHAQRIYDAVSNLHFMFSSPILSNAGNGNRGMPISCFLSYVPDTVKGLIQHQAETSWLSILGGGVGGHWSDVRAVSDKTVGIIPFTHTIDSAMTAYKQGKTRKGAYAAYLDVSHPDIEEFITSRTPTGGDINRKNFNSHHAVNITDDFMKAVYADWDWELKCPHEGSVRSVVSARELWESMLETRHRTGEPFLNFIDTANAHLHPVQKKLGLKIHGSNLCNEIHLATDSQRTAVCCLLSLNLEKYDEWKNTNLVQDLVEFLDNVLQYFIDTAPEDVSKAKYAAMRSRDIGIGAMGWHGYLMGKMIPFESIDAERETYKIFRRIKEAAVEKSIALAKERGSCPDAQEVGEVARNLHLLAIAPNANSSSICNATASVEPISSNAFAHRTRAGTDLIVNKYLVDFLYSKAPDSLEFLGVSKDDWVNDQINKVIEDEGSVQNLDYLTEEEKAVFKTFKEIDMHNVVSQAGIRQQFLCQGQSINLRFDADADRSYVNSVHLSAYERGLKGLYYLRTGSVKKIDKISDTLKDMSTDIDTSECSACHA
ncbi:ribonucleotide reductase of class Ia (aerobic) [Vibrio phage vB_VpaP_SJSY21]|nr:ribonucleotide reductase of class Ia (aerobic) [Vibrio phage vB_VpaP_SJSY21]